jgi:hypothetical protein
MTQDAVFRRDGALFVPSVYASGPWAADRLHGGPVFGLLTRAVEQAAADPALIGARLTFDLFRAVPLEPLSVQAEVLRRSSRLCLVQAGLHAGGEEYARVTALLLRADDSESPIAAEDKPLGPDGLATETLMRTNVTPGAVRPGFHPRVETRWVPRADHEPLAIWFRLPLPLVEGETPTPLQLSAALADFANAIAAIAGRGRDGGAGPYINVDATLYLSRLPRGEWIALKEGQSAFRGGMSVAQIRLFDTQGPFGDAQQCRLAQRRPG